MSPPQMSAIGELVEPISSWTPERDGPDGVFTYIDLSAVDQDAKIVSGARELACSEAPSRARQLVRAGDVLVSTVRPNLNGVARVPPEFDGATASTGFCVLRPRPDRLDGQFLYQWVKSPHFVSDMTRRATGASYPAVSDRIVCESKLPLPPLTEQRRIAKILDKADALRAKRRAALVQLEALTQAIFADMFGDPATNPSGWECRPLGSVATRFSDGPFGSHLKTEHYTDSGVRVVRLQNIGVGVFIDDDKAFISEAHFAQLKKHECLSGDILIGTLGDPNLRACIQPPWLTRALNKADCVQLRPDERVANAAYLCGLLNHPATERLAQDRMHGQTRVRISMGQLRTLELPMPPIDLQCRFAYDLAVVRKLETLHRKAMAGVDSLFASLQGRAFKGEL